MKRCMQRYNILFITLFISACGSSFTIVADHRYFPFDSLFPASWYQKGLESSLSTWQNLLDLFEKKSEATMLLCDTVLARLCFTQFCINRMKQYEMRFLPEDIAYFALVFKRIKSLVKTISITDHNEDFIVCIEEMILNIQKQIAELP